MTAEAEAREATAVLLAQRPATPPIFAGHDDIALEALAGIATAASARDVAVVGVRHHRHRRPPDDLPTSVDQRGIEMGSEAVTMLLERIQGRTLSRHHVVTPTLRIRTSTGPPR